MGYSPHCPHCKEDFHSIYAAAMHRQWQGNGDRCLTRQEMEAKGMFYISGAWVTQATPELRAQAEQEAQR